MSRLLASRVDAIKPANHAFTLILRDSRAIIRDLDIERVTRQIAPKVNDSALGSKFEGVIQKINQRLEQKRNITR